MPNGGVPINMVLYPKDGSDLVLYCRAGIIQIFTRKDWDEKKAQAEPLATFSESEGAATAWFLRYWLGEDRLKPGYNMRDIDTEFDF